MEFIIITLVLLYLVLCTGYSPRYTTTSLSSLTDAVTFVNDLTRYNSTSSSDSYKLTQAIRIFGDNKQLGSAISLLQTVSKTNLTLNTHHFAALLQAARNNKQGDIAEALFERSAKFNIVKNTLLCNIMISIYTDMCKPKEIMFILQNMRKDSIVIDAFTYSSSINGLCKLGEYKDALTVANLAMKSAYIRNIYVINAIMSMFAANRQWKEALKIFNDARVKQYPLDAASYSIMIHTLGEALEFDQAMEIFESMSTTLPTQTLLRRDVGVYNAIVTACERCKQWEEAKELLVRMEVEGVRPDCKTYCSAISCCGAAGQWREAMNIFKDIDRTGVRKDRAIYNALINSLQIAGKWNLAVDVLEKGSEDEILPSQQVEYLSAEEAFRRARDVYSKGVEEGALSEWYRDENDNLVLDLHHFPLSVAVTAVSLVFQKMRTSDISPARLRIITGRGNHINSSGSRGLLRAEIESFVLNEICPEGLLMIERVPGNDGCVDVTKESIAEWIASSSIKEDSHM